MSPPTWTWGSCLPAPDRGVATGSAHKYSNSTVHQNTRWHQLPSSRGASAQSLVRVRLMSDEGVQPADREGHGTCPTEPTARQTGQATQPRGLSWALLLPPPISPNFKLHLTLQQGATYLQGERSHWKPKELFPLSFLIRFCDLSPQIIKGRSW